MAIPLDSRVAQAVSMVKQLERALHDAGPWWVRDDEGNRYPAERTIEPDQVRFVTYLPTRGEQPVTIDLLCGQDWVSSRAITGPDDQICRIDWVLRIAAATQSVDA